MSAARHLGLDVAEDFLATTERGDSAFVSVRYDRVERDGRWVRLHQEDICQALSIPPDNKYQKDRGPGIAHIADLIRTFPDARDREESSRRFFEAIVFNVAAVGTNAHAKNYSILLDGDRVRLAPLYDLGSHAPYPSRGGAALESAMSVGGEYKLHSIGLPRLIAAGARLGVLPDESEARAHTILSGISDAYRQAAADAVDALGRHPFISLMVDSIDEHAVERGWRSKRTTTDFGG